jgi:outer membrane protein OmpA-like peptidoglycan-associated protein
MGGSMKNLFKLFAVFGLVFCLLSSAVFAQDVSLGLKGGAALYYGDVKDQKIGPYGGVSLDLWATKHFAVGILGYYAEIKGEEDTYSFKTPIMSGAALLKLRAFEEATLNPYIFGGVEGYTFNPQYGEDIGADKAGDKLPNNAADVYNKELMGVPVGAGVAIFLGERISLDLEGILHIPMTDALDDLPEGDKNDNYYTASLGLTFYFGKPKDTDGDGIPDKKDADKLNAEDFDSFEDLDGAPDLDNDQDGVLDANDKAPLDPEDKDGYQDEDGVPDPDNDGDGILDKADGAPDQAEDVDGFQDSDGVPDPDNDGDGILDSNDQCPGTDKTVADAVDTKETINEYEDTDGCPDKKPEIAVEKGQAIVLEGIFFASGSAKLDPNSETTLNKVVRTLAENTELEVEIRGYTDNKGKYESNVRLSQARAESVKAYLVKNGIAETRIKAQGFGPENPVDTNDTKDGRAKNRRIEFFRTK